MNTLTPFHLALEDSLGELLDRIEAQAEAAVIRIEETAAKADRNTAFNLARFRFGLVLDRIYGTGSEITALLVNARHRTIAEQGEIYGAYISGRSLHDRTVALDLGAPWHHDFTPKEHASCSTP